MKKISVKNDFSNVPAGRYYADGPVSGQRFREKFIAPALKQGSLLVILDAEGYGSSFLEECFGGLIRDEGFTKEELRSRLSFESSDSSVPQEIWEYIDEASEESN